MMELCLGVLGWTCNNWQQAGLFGIAAALSGRAYLHDVQLPYYGDPTSLNKDFLTKMMAMNPDKIEKVGHK